MTVLSRSTAVSLRSRLFWPLILFTLAVTLGSLVGEAFKTRLIGFMRFADFEELVINSLFYLVSLVMLNDLFFESKASRALRMTFVGLIVTFMIGQGLHIAANSVNAFSTEIRDYKSILPADMYALLYFIDENLSHVIIYLSRYGLFACILILDARYLSRSETARPQWLALGTGVLYGLWEAILFLEGQKLYLVPFVMLALGGVWIWLWRRSRQPLSTFWRSGTMIAFCVGLLVIPLGLLLWFALTGSWCEPSQFFMGRCH
jgi:hypothetical protein